MSKGREIGEIGGEEIERIKIKSMEEGEDSNKGLSDIDEGGVEDVNLENSGKKVKVGSKDKGGKKGKGKKGGKSKKNSRVKPPAKGRGEYEEDVLDEDIMDEFKESLNDLRGKNRKKSKVMFGLCIFFVFPDIACNTCFWFACNYLCFSSFFVFLFSERKQSIRWSYEPT